MSANNGSTILSGRLNAYSAMLLSTAAYKPIGSPIPGELGIAWKEMDEYSARVVDQKDGRVLDQFRVMKNEESKQIVIVFKGTDNIENFRSDMSDSGASAYKAIYGLTINSLDGLRADFSDYQVLTTGHSLGAGMAQSLALEKHLDGFGFNGLPIAKETFDEVFPGQNPAQLIEDYRASNKFIDTVNQGDVANIKYRILGGEHYLDETPTTLPSLTGSAVAIGLLAMVVNPIGLVVAGIVSVLQHFLPADNKVDDQVKVTGDGRVAIPLPDFSISANSEGEMRSYRQQLPDKSVVEFIADRSGNMVTVKSVDNVPSSVTYSSADGSAGHLQFDYIDDLWTATGEATGPRPDLTDADWRWRFYGDEDVATGVTNSGTDNQETADPDLGTVDPSGDNQGSSDSTTDSTTNDPTDPGTVVQTSGDGSQNDTGADTHDDTSDPGNGTSDTDLGGEDENTVDDSTGTQDDGIIDTHVQPQDPFEPLPPDYGIDVEVIEPEEASFDETGERNVLEVRDEQGRLSFRSWINDGANPGEESYRYFDDGSVEITRIEDRWNLMSIDIEGYWSNGAYSRIYAGSDGEHGEFYVDQESDTERENWTYRDGATSVADRHTNPDGSSVDRWEGRFEDGTVSYRNTVIDTDGSRHFWSSDPREGTDYKVEWTHWANGSSDWYSEQGDVTGTGHYDAVTGDSSGSDTDPYRSSSWSIVHNEDGSRAHHVERQEEAYQGTQISDTTYYADGGFKETASYVDAEGIRSVSTERTMIGRDGSYHETWSNSDGESHVEDYDASMHDTRTTSHTSDLDEVEHLQWNADGSGREERYGQFSDGSTSHWSAYTFSDGVEHVSATSRDANGTTLSWSDAFYQNGLPIYVSAGARAEYETSKNWGLWPELNMEISDDVSGTSDIGSSGGSGSMYFDDLSSGAPSSQIVIASSEEVNVLQ